MFILTAGFMELPVNTARRIEHPPHLSVCGTVGGPSAPSGVCLTLPDNPVIFRIQPQGSSI